MENLENRTTQDKKSNFKEFLDDVMLWGWGWAVLERLAVCRHVSGFCEVYHSIKKRIYESFGREYKKEDFEDRIDY